MHCPVCDGTDIIKRETRVQSVYSKKSYDLDQCKECGHVFTSPAPSAKDLAFIYNNLYGYEAHHLIEKEKQFRGKEYAAVVAQQVPQGKVLEVGCMHGYLLSALKKRGYDVSGVELDGKAVEYCQSQGLNVTNSSLEDFLATSKEKYDVIFMSHVLEHITDPKESMRQLKKHLTKNGRLIVVVPNSGALSAKLFGKYWGYWQVPVHINHFNRSSMDRLVKESGCSLLTMRFFGGDSLLSLSTLANLTGNKNRPGEPLSAAKKLLVKAASAVLRYWYKIGREDMLAVIEKA